MVDARAEPSRASLREGRSVVAYAVPIAVFAVLTALEGLRPASAYPVAYIVKIAAVTAALGYFAGRSVTSGRPGGSCHSEPP